MCSSDLHEGDDGWASRLPGSDCGLIEVCGERFRGRMDGGLLDLISRCGLKTELTDAVAFVGGDGRPKNTAGLGTRGVEIAGAVFGIQCGAGLVVAEILKSGNGLATFVEFEGARGYIARKVRGKA